MTGDAQVLGSCFLLLYGNDYVHRSFKTKDQ